MPRRKSKAGRRRKKRYSTSSRKLADKRINTLFEKRAEEIAKKEIAKDRINLVLRRRIHAYDPATNYFTLPADKLTFAGWGPLVLEENLRLRVSSTLPGGGQPIFANNPETIDDESIYPMVYPFDTALPVTPTQGTRATDEIMIDSIHVKVRVQQNESVQNAYCRGIVSEYALFRVTKDYLVSTALPTTPTLFAGGKFRPWDYNSKMADDALLNVQEPWKIRKLASVTVTTKPDDRFPDTKFVSFTWKPKNAVHHKFIQGRPNGDSLKHRYLLAARCTTPNVVLATIADCQPTFHMCAFINYHE